jgi:hypothetical protein
LALPNTCKGQGTNVFGNQEVGEIDRISHDKIHNQQKEDDNIFTQ